MQRTNLLLFFNLFLLYVVNGQTDCIENPRENILYAGFYNSLIYVHPDYPCDSIIAISQNAIIEGNPCKMTVYPISGDIAKINIISVKGKDSTLIAEKIFRVKNIPAPKMAIAGKTGGPIQKSEIIIQLGISLYSEVQIKRVFTINKYLFIVVRGEKIILSKVFKGRRFTKKELKYYNKLQHNDRLILVNLDTVDGKGSNVFVQSSEFLIL